MGTLNANVFGQPVGKGRRLDQVGAGLSLACALHCLFLPFLVSVLPLIGLGFLVDHTVEVIFVAFSILLATTSICLGFRYHGRLRAAAVLIFSVGCLATAFIIIEHGQHMPLLVAGALGIAASHLINHKLCKSCVDCCDHESQEAIS